MLRVVDRSDLDKAHFHLGWRCFFGVFGGKVSIGHHLHAPPEDGSVHSSEVTLAARRARASRCSRPRWSRRSVLPSEGSTQRLFWSKTSPKGKVNIFKPESQLAQSPHSRKLVPFLRFFSRPYRRGVKAPTPVVSFFFFFVFPFHLPMYTKKCM